MYVANDDVLLLLSPGLRCRKLLSLNLEECFEVGDSVLQVEVVRVCLSRHDPPSSLLASYSNRSLAVDVLFLRKKKKLL